MNTQRASAISLKIFLVEDHEDTAEYLRRYLVHLGHDVVVSRTIAEASTKLPGADYDVLISDLGLPDGNGWQLLELVDLPDQIYAVAMSGYGMGADRIRSREAGFRHHLVKPAVTDKLDLILQEAAAEVAERRQLQQ